MTEAEKIASELRSVNEDLHRILRRVETLDREYVTADVEALLRIAARESRAAAERLEAPAVGVPCV